MQSRSAVAALFLSLTSDEDPLVAISDRAGLTLAEYEAVAMRAGGCVWPEIAKAQHVSDEAARMAGRRGHLKLRRYVARRLST